MPDSKRSRILATLPPRARRAMARLLPVCLGFFLVSTLPSLPSTAAAAGTLTPPADRALYRITPARGQRMEPLLALGIDVAGTAPDGSLDVILTPDQVSRVRALGFDPRPLDLTPRGVQGAAESPLGGIGAYHTYSGAVSEMQTYAATYPSLARVDTIGTSVEGRAIVAIKIAQNVAVQGTAPEVLVAGCHHARELMSVEIPLYLMRRLLDGYGVDTLITRLVDQRQIWILPVVNPDGHVYVEQHNGGSSDTWWRKNRRPNADGSYGVDLNRNYGFNWGYDDIGSSPTPSADTYRGTGPFSEPEITAIRDFMDAHHFRISASFHSYGDLFLYPWGYAMLDTPDNDVFASFGDSVSVQNGYRSGNPRNGAIYETNGDMDDWVYGDTSSKPQLFGFTFEVNSATDGGFDPPSTLIGPTCDLNWGPLLTLLRYADEPRRILPPLRAGRPAMVLVAGQPGIEWSYAARDPLNLPVRHDVRRIGTYSVGTDDAESGVADWDSVSFSWSTARYSSATHSYYSGSADNLTSVLSARAPIPVASLTDSLVVEAWWALEQDYDYWYAEASTDGGVTWLSLPGEHTTLTNPFGRNLGYGVTGSSNGFERSAFWVGNFEGHQILVRFRCITDGTNHLEGLYLDDLAPTAHMAGTSVTATSTPDTTYVVPPPYTASWFQVRPVDAEGQAAPWSDVATFDPTFFTGVTATPASLVDRLQVTGANPFHPATSIRMTVGSGAPGPYRLDVFDVHGRLVRELADGSAGRQGLVRLVRWDGSDRWGRPLGSGVYLLQMRSPRGRIASKLTLLH